MAAAVTYFFGFDLAVDAAGFSLAITRGAYSYTVTDADFATSTVYLNSLADGDGYVSFDAALGAALIAAATAAGDPQAADWSAAFEADVMLTTIDHFSGAW